MYVLEYFNDGSRVMVTRTKPIKTMADLQGLNDLGPPSKVFLETFKAFGAAATPMAYGDLLPALQQGVVDGCDFGLALIEPARAYEIAKHVSTTPAYENRAWTAGELVMAKKVFHRTCR